MLTNDQINIRDPFVLVHDHRYYLYGTRGESCWGPADGFDVYVGDDLNSWKGPFVCFRNDGTFWADRNYWAPEVHAFGGAYYMFASFKGHLNHGRTGLSHRIIGNALTVRCTFLPTAARIWFSVMNGFRPVMVKSWLCRSQMT